MIVKQEIRKKIWDLLEEKNIARFPRPVYGRIPNFVGAQRAAKKLGELKEWNYTSVIKANPDSPQKWVRKKAMDEGKIVYMAVPRLRKEKCFLQLNSKGISSERAVTIKGAFAYGKEVFPWEMKKVDMLIVGSVAVNKEGARIGKGGGYSDLEFAIGREMGIITENTLVVTTVHPLQVVDAEIPMESHDVPVDYIVTPSRIIASHACYKKPYGIDWNMLEREQIEKIPILKKLDKYRK